MSSNFPDGHRDSAGSVWQTILETKREDGDVRQGNYIHYFMPGVGWLSPT